MFVIGRNVVFVGVLLTNKGDSATVNVNAHMRYCVYLVGYTSCLYVDIRSN